jgi:hypothetical protein
MLLKNEAGVSIVQTLVMGGIMTVGFLAYSAMLEKSKRAAAGYASRAAMEEVVSEIKLRLADMKVCGEKFRSRRNPSRPKEFKYRIFTNTTDKEPVAIAGLFAGKRVSETLVVDAIDLVEIRAEGMPIDTYEIVPLVPLPGHYPLVGKIRLQLRRSGPGTSRVFGAETLHYEFPIFLMMADKGGSTMIRDVELMYCSTADPYLKEMVEPPSGGNRKVTAADCYERGGTPWPIGEDTRGVMRHVCRIPDLDPTGNNHVSCPLGRTYLANATANYGEPSQKYKYPGPQLRRWAKYPHGPIWPLAPGGVVGEDGQPKRVAISCH